MWLVSVPSPSPSAQSQEYLSMHHKYKGKIQKPDIFWSKYLWGNKLAVWRGICPIGCDTATHLGEERKQYQVISQYGKTIFVCIYNLFFRCFLPKSTKYRTSSIFGTWCFTMLFWNFVLAYFLPLGDSFTVLMRRNCLKVLKLSGNSHSPYHNIKRPRNHHRHHQHQHAKQY